MRKGCVRLGGLRGRRRGGRRPLEPIADVLGVVVGEEVSLADDRHAVDVEHGFVDHLTAAFDERQRVDVEDEALHPEELAFLPAGGIRDDEAGVIHAADEKVGLVVLDREVGAGLAGKGGVKEPG